MNDSRRLLPIALAFAFLAGCDSSAEKDKKGSVSAETRMEQANKLLEEAKAAGADKFASEEFDLLSKKLEDSQKLIDDGKGDKSISKIASASAGFKDLIQRVGEFKKNQAAATESKKKAEAAIASAKRLQIDANAKEAWDDVEKLMEKANADLQDPKKVQGASASFLEVQNRIKIARQSAEGAKQWKEKAEAQMKATKELEGQAVQERASTADLTFARQLNLEAESDFKNEKFQEAFINFQRAGQGFADALTRAKEAKEVAVGNTPGDPQNPNPPDAGAGEAKKGETPPAEPAAAAEKVGKKGPAEPAPEAGKVAEDELSPDDEDFLAKNISKFSAKRPVEYDPGSGMITVEYPFGDELKKDLFWPPSRGYDPTHIIYKDPIMQQGSKDLKGQKELGLSFGGNTSGFFLLPFPFKDSITYEFRVFIAMMKNEGTLTAVFMSSKDSKSYIGANFGTVEFWKDGRLISSKPPTDPKYKGSANKWFSKIKLMGVGMRVVLEPHKDGKRSIVKIFYDTDEEAEEPINSFAVPSRSGFAGFSWFASKFNLAQWKITGKLDKVAAVKLLKAKLEDAAAGGAGKAGKAGKDGSGAGAQAGDDKAAKPKKAAAKKPAAGEGDADEKGGKGVASKDGGENAAKPKKDAAKKAPAGEGDADY